MFQSQEALDSLRGRAGAWGCGADPSPHSLSPWPSPGDFLGEELVRPAHLGKA